MSYRACDCLNLALISFAVNLIQSCCTFFTHFSIHITCKCFKAWLKVEIIEGQTNWVLIITCKQKLEISYKLTSAKWFFFYYLLNGWSYKNDMCTHWSDRGNVYLKQMQILLWIKFDLTGCVIKGCRSWWQPIDCANHRYSIR